MKKILLIGKPGDIIRSISEYLDEHFMIQICFNQIDMMKDMTKVFRPDMLVYCQTSGEDVDGDAFYWLKESKKPILVICTKEEWSGLEQYCEGDSFYHILRPLQLSSIAAKCAEILNEDRELLTAAVEEVKAEETDYMKKIMVVDDSSLVIRNVKHILEEKYQVSVATSGEKAIKLLPQKQPDLILLDYEMPGMTGKETYEHILEMPEYCDIPVIFLTSVSDKQRVIDILEKNPAGYILKPITGDALLEKIEAVLAHV